jgi:hypothetical protein
MYAFTKKGFKIYLKMSFKDCVDIQKPAVTHEIVCPYQEAICSDLFAALPNVLFSNL